jgi:hypothetical protein
MPGPYRYLPPPGCQAGGGDPHPAELVPGTVLTCLFAAHDGAHLPSCAARSGLCHPACRPVSRYPGLRECTCPLATRELARPVRDGAGPAAVEPIVLGAEAARRAR